MSKEIIDDTFEKTMILYLLGIQKHHDKVIIIRSYSIPLNPIYKRKGKKKIDIGSYISIDFEMFKNWKDFLNEIRNNNPYYIEYDSFEDIKSLKFRIRFSYPLGDDDGTKSKK